MPTKAVYISDLLAEIGRTDKTSAASGWFDDVYQLLNNYHNWSYLDTKATRPTVADTFVYGWPSDFRACSVVYMDTGDTNSRKLIYKGLPEFTRLYPRVESIAASWPVHWTNYDGQLMIAPRPAGVWNLRLIYTANPPQLTDQQSPLFSVDFDHMFRSGLRGYGYASIREFDKSKYNFDLFFKLMDEKKKKDQDVVSDESFLQRFQGGIPAGPEYWLDPMVRRVN
jgi:hypothetical protein